MEYEYDYEPHVQPRRRKSNAGANFVVLAEEQALKRKLSCTLLNMDMKEKYQSGVEVCCTRRVQGKTNKVYVVKMKVSPVMV